MPTPGIVAVTPVPEGSLMDHDKRTIWCPPIKTLPGFAVKLVMVGDGQASTATVVCADEGDPQADVAVNV